jgi:hypothetical protein
MQQACLHVSLPTKSIETVQEFFTQSVMSQMSTTLNQSGKKNFTQRMLGHNYLQLKQFPVIAPSYFGKEISACRSRRRK